MSIVLANRVIESDIQEILASPLDWSRFKNKHILITGANGFLPAYLVYTLLAANDAFQLQLKVTGLCRNAERAQHRFQHLTGNASFHVRIADVCDPPAPAPYDFIIHAASQASPRYYGSDPIGTALPNTVGTYNLLKHAVNFPVEAFMYFSSSEVYGKVSDAENPIRETTFGYLDPAQVRSCYAESKRMGETFCMGFFQQYKVPVKIVRPFHTYGPGMDLHDGRVYADFVKNMVEGEAIVMHSDGKAKRAFCYVADATIGFLTVLLEGSPGEAYNIGNTQEEYSIRELAELLAGLDAGNKQPVVYHPNTNPAYLASPVLRNCPDCTKAERIGWKASTPVETGFAKTITSYR